MCFLSTALPKFRNAVVSSINVQNLFQVRYAKIRFGSLIPHNFSITRLFLPFLKNLNFYRLKLYLCIPTEQSGFFIA